jgi:isopentenyl diphosphate isomerase/L-lactate dehydrogenase-like FMN-dependent dehydrogenase
LYLINIFREDKSMDLVNVFDYEKLAATKVDPPAWDFYQGGSDDEITLRANRQAFERIRLRPRVLVDVSKCDLSTSVLGTPISMPVVIAPTAGHGLAHPDGECATARAAHKAGTLMAVSTDSTRSLEDIAAASNGPLWFQLYIHTYNEAEELVKRAEAAGYKGIVLTVDLPRFSKRERDLRHNFERLNRERFPAAFKGNANHLVGKSAEEDLHYVGDTLTWDVITWLHSITTLPIIVKGILTGEDAALALEHGANGIIVSNHGGRQIDGAIASIDALPEVLQAVGGRCEVLVDGGIRRGTDILKALALGARAVLVGRPILWGLAVQGQDGVSGILEILRHEFELALALSGCPIARNVTRALVRVQV